MDAYFIVREETLWNQFIMRSKRYDVYHLWRYHIIDQSGDPVLFVYQKNDLFIALPLIKRKISGSNWYDLTCVYGYGGPVSNYSLETLKQQDISDFKIQFLHFMEQEQCVCVFSRLHPFLGQHHLLGNIGGVSNNGKTLYMDLSNSYEDQVEGYEKRMARQIRQLKKQDYIIKGDIDDESIRAFHEMYTLNMLRVSASANYFFTEEYFANLLRLNPNHSSLLMVYDGEKPACGAIVFHSNQIIRNHLSATNEDYLKESPSKLLTDYISILGRRKNIRYFHLGGGVGGKEDSLFKYKSHFSRLTIDDYIWRFVANENAYNSLVEMKGLADAQESNYFPLYRSRQMEVAE